MNDKKILVVEDDKDLISLIDFNFNKSDVISKNICTCCGNEDFKTIFTANGNLFY